MSEAEDLFTDLFQGCALTAFLQQAYACQGWPDPEETRQRAYTLYEEALAERNRAKSSEEENPE